MYCYFCKAEVNTKDVSAFRLLQGWVPNRKKGANAVALPSGTIAWAHGGCIEQEKQEGSVSWGQENLF
jgi:hypothetical protein